MKRVRIVGGPSAHTVHVFDADTGEEVYVRAIEFQPWVVGTVLEVKLTVVAEVETQAEVVEPERPNRLRAGHDAFVAQLKARGRMA